jgi:hypothetical protein
MPAKGTSVKAFLYSLLEANLRLQAEFLLSADFMSGHWRSRFASKKGLFKKCNYC